MSVRSEFMKMAFPAWHRATEWRKVRDFMRETITAHESTIASLRLQVERKQESIAAYNRTVRVLQSVNSELFEQVSDLRSGREIRRLEAQIGELGAMNAELAEQNRELKRQLSIAVWGLPTE